MSPDSSRGSSSWVIVLPSSLMERSPMWTMSRTPASLAACLASVTISTPITGTAGPMGSYLHSLYQRLIGEYDANGLFKVNVLAAGQFGLVVEPSAGYVEHTNYTGPGVRHDVLGEAAERVAARASGVHDGSDARINACEVGVNSGLVDAVIDVGVQVYQARCDEFAGYVDDASIGGGGDVRGYL